MERFREELPDASVLAGHYQFLPPCHLGMTRSFHPSVLSRRMVFFSNYMPARQIKSLPDPDHGFKHREHRSKRGRRKRKIGETKTPIYRYKLKRIKESEDNETSEPHRRIV